MLFFGRTLAVSHTFWTKIRPNMTKGPGDEEARLHISKQYRKIQKSSCGKNSMPNTYQKWTCILRYSKTQATNYVEQITWQIARFVKPICELHGTLLKDLSICGENESKRYDFSTTSRLTRQKLIYSRFCMFAFVPHGCHIYPRVPL